MNSNEASFDDVSADSSNLKEKIMKSLPKLQIGQNPSLTEMMQVNQLLVKYFFDNELQKEQKKPETNNSTNPSAGEKKVPAPKGEIAI
jgi:hypothetical protein